MQETEKTLFVGVNTQKTPPVVRNACFFGHMKRISALSGVCLQAVSIVGVPHNIHSLHKLKLLEEVGQEDKVCIVLESFHKNICSLAPMYEPELLHTRPLHLPLVISVDVVPKVLDT